VADCLLIDNSLTLKGYEAEIRKAEAALNLSLREILRHRYQSGATITKFNVLVFEAIQQTRPVTLEVITPADPIAPNEICRGRMFIKDRGPLVRAVR